MLPERDKSAELVCVGREVDLTDRARALALFRDAGPVDYVIHLADVSGSADWAVANAVPQFLANCVMTANVIDGWTQFQPGARLIGMSSLWAYPEQVSLADEDRYWEGRLHRATEHYGLSKKLLGVGIGAAFRQTGARGTMLVLGSVYGPGDTSGHLIPSLIRRMRENPEYLRIQGDGMATRDFIFIDDQIEAILRHLDFEGELLNIGSGVTHRVRDVVDSLVRLMPYRGAVVYDPATASGVKERRLDVSRANAMTGWPTKFVLHSLDAGLAKTLAASKLV